MSVSPAGVTAGLEVRSGGRWSDRYCQYTLTTPSDLVHVGALQLYKVSSVLRIKKISDILQVLIYILGSSCRFINPLLRGSLLVMWIFVVHSTQDMGMDGSLHSVGALRVAGHHQEGPEALHQVPMRDRDSCELFSWGNIQHAQIKV